MEFRNRPDDFNVLVGAFEREPPLYYQMRVDRITIELKAHPEELNLYDDIAVACDRLGKDDEAIAWIEKKRARLHPLDMSVESSRDNWYRYYANCGTFYAHRWFAHGAKDSELGQMKHGRDLIAKAIEINPQAHFNREQAQLKVMDWVINRNTDNYEPLCYSFRTSDDIQGLLGLIRLGGAWRSVDVYLALSGAYEEHQRGPFAAIAYMRAKELLDAGQKPIDPNFERKAPSGFMLPVSKTGHIYNLTNAEISQYRQLRAEADSSDKNREDAMLVKLRAGKHPDTDPDFWDGIPAVPKLIYHETAGEMWDRTVGKAFSYPDDVLTFACIAILAAIGAYVRSNRKAKRVRATQNQRLYTGKGNS